MPVTNISATFNKLSIFAFCVYILVSSITLAISKILHSHLFVQCLRFILVFVFKESLVQLVTLLAE